VASGQRNRRSYGDSRFGWRARGAGLEHKRRAIVPVWRLKKEPKFDWVSSREGVATVQQIDGLTQWLMYKNHDGKSNAACPRHPADG
jgi:hypothetical protein